MIEISWNSQIEGRTQAQSGGYSAVIAKWKVGWGWTVLLGDASGAHWEGGQCETLEEAKAAAEAVIRQKIDDETGEVARLQMVKNRNAEFAAVLNRRKV